MRTTLTLDDDVARLIEEAVHREHRSMKEVVNERLRQALAPPRAREPYSFTPHSSEIKPGVDISSLNRLADELEDETIIEKIRKDL